MQTILNDRLVMNKEIREQSRKVAYPHTSAFQLPRWSSIPGRKCAREDRWWPWQEPLAELQELGEAEGTKR